MATPHYDDAQAEIRKTVAAGPIEDNVFIRRCRRTGDAVPFDAANSWRTSRNDDRRA